MHRSPINPGGDAGYLERHGALSIAGDARQFSLDELSFAKCRRILGGGNATERPRWSLLGSCETDDLLDAQQESAIRVHVSSPWQHRHCACRQEVEKISRTRSSLAPSRLRKAEIDWMSQSSELSHKRCDEREPGTTRTARGQQTV